MPNLGARSAIPPYVAQMGMAERAPRWGIPKPRMANVRNAQLGARSAIPICATYGKC